jgi:hypothetical protein
MFDNISKVPCNDTNLALDQMSFTKVIDPRGFRAFFKHRFSEFLHANYRNAEEVAVLYGVRYQTALNWWQGINAPSGDTTTLAAIRHGSNFTEFMGRKV